MVRASSSPAREKLFFKISYPSKNFKNANTQPDRKTFGQLVVKLNIKKGCETRTKERQGITLCISNSGFNAKSEVGAFNKLSRSGQVIALKSATAHTLDRYHSMSGDFAQHQ
ncbi:hypothetical protein [Flavobacterium daejeonense]|uniref:hypothetical protein n=1 Tax=Flavobacterium daejeonense TaxID=350893 RepID=UPI0012DF465D|nr:hypothetical protein [Flavobacterium daejeonense]